MFNKPHARTGLRASIFFIQAVNPKNVVEICGDCYLTDRVQVWLSSSWSALKPRL